MLFPEHVSIQKTCNKKGFAASVKALVESVRVPIGLPMDHDYTYEALVDSLESGFESAMMDGSMNNLDTNIAITKKVVDKARLVGAIIKGEIGHVGLAAESANENEDLYTKPETAEKFCRETGVDTLAVAIGTCHGLYPAGMKPELKLDILKEIAAKVDIPLVLHGGFNNPDAEIGESVTLGINKINISSDTKAAYFEKMREVLQDKSLREPNVIEPLCMEAMKEVARHKLELFQTIGKASLFEKEALQVISNEYDNIFSTEKKVADFVMTNPHRAVEFNVSELAKASGVSDATVVRVCHHIGYTGYHQFRIALSRDLGKMQQCRSPEESRYDPYI